MVLSARSPASDAPTALRILAAASLGNALEWYDFSIYVLFAAHIAHQFFPASKASIELIRALLVFGVGFVVRPLGALIIGAYGDIAGRKASLTLTISLMALGTLIIAAAPPYAVLGMGAPVLLLAGRMLQGFSAGGEVGGAAAFLVEQAPAHRRNLYGSVLQASMAASNILGALAALGVATLLTMRQIDDWGWRIPFLLGLAIAPVGLWLRHSLNETPEFEPAPRNRTGRMKPILSAVSRHWAALIQGFAISVLWAVSVYTLVIYMPVHVQETLGFKPAEAFTASLVANLALAACCFVSGLLADTFGRRRIMTASAAALLALVWPLLFLLESFPHPLTLVAVQTAFCALVGLFSGAAPAALAALFPASVRTTGMSISYNAAVTIFGGFAPAALAALSSTALGAAAPALYVTAAALLALPAITRLPGKSARLVSSPAQSLQASC